MPTNNIRIDEGNGVVLMTAAKAGNTSLKTALRAAGVSPHEHIRKGWNHLTPAEAAACPHPKVAVMRHPIQRVVSTWMQKVMDPAERTVMHRHPGVRVGMPLAEFVALVIATPDDRADGHYRSQHYLRHHAGRYLPDHTVRIEESPDWWGWFKKLSGLNLAPLGRENRSWAPNWWDALTDAQIADLADRYALDFKLGGHDLR